MTMSHGAGVAWYLWRQGRLYIAALALTIALVACLLHFLPAENIPAPWFAVIFLLCVPAMIASAQLATNLSFGPTDFGKRGSGFPSQMLVLPMTTGALAGWPLVLGTAVVAAMYALVYVALILPFDMAIDHAVALGLATSMLAWIQAAAWFPFALPFARAAFTIIVLAALGVAAGWMTPRQIPASTETIFFATATLLAYLTAYCGVRLARRGEIPALFPTRIADARRSRVLAPKPFSSPAAAQLWYELRRNAIWLPLMIGLMSAPLCVPLMSKDRLGLTFGEFTIPARMIAAGIALFGPLLLSSAMSGGLGKFDYWSNQVPTFNSFFSTRPFSTPAFVVTKFKSAAIATMATWGIVLALFAIAFYFSPPAPEDARIPHGIPTPLLDIRLALPLALLLTIFLTFRNNCASLVFTLCGRAWITAMSGVLFALVIGLFMTALYWGWQHPEHHARMGAIAVGAAWSIAGLKLLTIPLTSAALYRTRLMHASGLVLSLGLWAMGCAVLLAILATLLGLSLMMVAAAILLMPFNRIALAFFALRWNRHR